jgi:DedD protein
VGGLVKERLTGAIILVALIVLFVPELLRGPVTSAARVAPSSAEEPPLRSYTIHLGDDAHARSAAAQPQSAAPQPLSAAPVQAPATQDAPPVAAEPADTPAAAPPAPAPHTVPAAAPAPVATGNAAGGAWMVQLGSFASRTNAERLAHQLKTQGFTASVSQGTTGRHLYRVRVGPVHDRNAATHLQAKLQGTGHTGSVVPK